MQSSSTLYRIGGGSPGAHEARRAAPAKYGGRGYGSGGLPDGAITMEMKTSALLAHNPQQRASKRRRHGKHQPSSPQASRPTPSRQS